MTFTLLLYAEPLVTEGLTRWIETERPSWRVHSGFAPQASPRPELVLWQPLVSSEPLSVLIECQSLRDRWQPVPILVLLSPGHRLNRSQLLALPALGVLEAPAPERLLAAITTLAAGGRVLELKDGPAHDESQPAVAGPGPGQGLLLHGLQQIEAERLLCLDLLSPPPGPLTRLVLQGRLRELAAARQLLLWLWGPLSLAWAEQNPVPASSPAAGPGTSLTLPQRSSEAVWTAIQTRLQSALDSGVANGSGQLLALDGLSPQRRTDLLMALLQQLALLRQRLIQDPLLQGDLQERWQSLQPELRRQALRAMASPYVQLPLAGSLQPVADTLLRSSDLETPVVDLPDPAPLLAALVQGHPLVVNGTLVPSDEPRAVLHLEQLVANWLLRSAEQIAAEVLSSCSEWPELRRYLLCPELLPTRNLDRLRNQLNAQNRWWFWFEHPVELYESRRTLLCLQGGEVQLVTVTEPRDAELRQLGWLPQLVTLALETRDAVGPQLRRLLKGLGDLAVVVLTQVLGRAIGLIGRGVVQGMGRSLSRG